MNLMHHTAILWRGPGSVQIGGDRARHVRLDTCTRATNSGSPARPTPFTPPIAPRLPQTS